MTSVPPGSHSSRRLRLVFLRRLVLLLRFRRGRRILSLHLLLLLELRLLSVVFLLELLELLLVLLIELLVRGIVSGFLSESGAILLLLLLDLLAFQILLGSHILELLLMLLVELRIHVGGVRRLRVVGWVKGVRSVRVFRVVESAWGIRGVGRVGRCVGPRSGRPIVEALPVGIGNGRVTTLVDGICCIGIIRCNRPVRIGLHTFGLSGQRLRRRSDLDCRASLHRLGLNLVHLGNRQRLPTISLNRLLLFGKRRRWRWRSRLRDYRASLQRRRWTHNGGSTGSENGLFRWRDSRRGGDDLSGRHFPCIHGDGVLGN